MEKNILRFISAFMVTAVMMTPGLGQLNKSGRTAMQFVKIGIGARQTALGEAGIAIGRDVNAIFWNPASIAGIQSAQASFSYTSWFADLRYVAGAAGFRWDGIATFAVGFAGLGYGRIPEALYRVPSGSADTRTGNTFSGGDYMWNFAVSREFTDKLSIGAGIKLLKEHLHVYEVQVVAFDVGTNYEIGYKGMRIAMSAQNFGSPVKWLANSNRREGYDLPLIFRIGYSLRLVDDLDGIMQMGAEHRVEAALDAVHTNDYGDRVHVGMEYTFKGLLALRGGYRFNYTEGNLSLGFGLNADITGTNFKFDYSFTSFEFLESPHRLTVLVEL